VVTVTICKICKLHILPDSINQAGFGQPSCITVTIRTYIYQIYILHGVESENFQQSEHEICYEVSNTVEKVRLLNDQSILLCDLTSLTSEHLIPKFYHVLHIVMNISANLKLFMAFYF